MHKYLSDTPCAQQSSEQIRTFLERTKDWPVTKVERLQILNLRPESVLEMYAVFEEADERFGGGDEDAMMDELGLMLESVQEVLRTPGTHAAGDAGMAAGEGAQASTKDPD